MEPTLGKAHPARRARLAAGALSATALVGLTGYLAADRAAPAVVAATSETPAAAALAPAAATPTTVAPSARSGSTFSGAIPARPSLRSSTRSRGS